MAPTTPRPDAVTALRTALGIEVPLLGAPMARIAGGRLAAAVSEAGGLGFLGGGYGDLDWLDRELDGVGPAAVGVGLITWRLDGQPHVLDRVLERRPRAVWLSYGDPSPYVDRVRRAGAVVVCQVLDVASATAALQAGADVLVVQGSEAGGHGRAGRGLLTLLPAVVAHAGGVPVVAAGGIATGRQLAACWALGAAGAALGTRLYATHEAADAAEAKQRLVDAAGDDTLHTTVFDLLRGPEWPAGYSGRAIANDATRRWHGHEADLVPVLDGERERYRRDAAAGDLRSRVVWAGEAVDHVHAVEPAAAVVRAIHRDALRAWA
jgi:nitronate monooxygenase